MNVLYTFPDPDPDAPSKEHGPRKRISPWILVGFILVAGTVVFVLQSLKSNEYAEESSMTALDIKSTIIQTATHRPSNPIHPNGGVLGPWWIYARGSNGDSLLGLCLESDDLHVGASRAFIRLDSHRDSLSLILENAVIAILPSGDVDGRVEHHDLIEIGPIPLSIDVLDDSFDKNGFGCDQENTNVETMVMSRI